MATLGLRLGRPPCLRRRTGRRPDRRARRTEGSCSLAGRPKAAASGAPAPRKPRRAERPRRRGRCRGPQGGQAPGIQLGLMVVSIGAVASPAQGVSYYERDGYYAKDDPAHREASAWAGKGAEALGLSGPVDPDTFKAILEGNVPDGPRLGRPGKNGEITHRPGRDLTFSAPKSASLAALVGGDGRIAGAHDLAVTRTLAWLEATTVETRMKDPETGRHGPRRRPEDGGRDLPARHLAQSRSPAPYPRGDRQHGAGRGRQVAHHGQRGALPPPEAHRHGLPERACKGAGGAWLRHREDPRRRPLRDLGRAARGDRGVLDAARRDRGGDGRTRAWTHGGESASGRARGADDPRPQARGRQGRAARDLENPGRRTGVLSGEGGRRCPGAGGPGDAVRGDRSDGRRSERRPFGRAGVACRHWGTRAGPAGIAAAAAGGRGGAVGDGASVRARSGVLARRPACRRAGVAARRRLDRGRRESRRRSSGARAAACGPGASRRRRHDHRQGPGRRARDHRPDAERTRQGPGGDAELDGPGAAAQGTADEWPETGGEADPLREGPRGRRAGLCRDRQDHHAEPRPRARRTRAAIA